MSSINHNFGETQFRTWHNTLPHCCAMRWPVPPTPSPAQKWDSPLRPKHWKRTHHNTMMYMVFCSSSSGITAQLVTGGWNGLTSSIFTPTRLGQVQRRWRVYIINQIWQKLCLPESGRECIPNSGFPFRRFSVSKSQFSWRTSIFHQISVK